MGPRLTGRVPGIVGKEASCFACWPVVVPAHFHCRHATPALAWIKASSSLLPRHSLFGALLPLLLSAAPTDVHADRGREMAKNKSFAGIKAALGKHCPGSDRHGVARPTAASRGTIQDREDSRVSR